MLRFAWCCFVLVFFGPLSIEITLLVEERANLSAFHAFVQFVLVWFCLFPLSLSVWEGLWFVTGALPGLFSYFFLPGVILFLYFSVLLALQLPLGEERASLGAFRTFV